MNCLGSEKCYSGVMNLPCDFGKKTGRKLWAAKVAALVGVPRGKDGAVSRHEGVAR
jgi:hypothetical protein